MRPSPINAPRRTGAFMGDGRGIYPELHPDPDAIDIDGLDVTESDLKEALRVVPAEWDTELAGIEEWYTRFGDSLPDALSAELSSLKERFAA